MDRIFLHDHVRKIEIGAFAEERIALQSVRFNVELELDQPRPQDDEDVDLILSYDVIIEAIDLVLGRQRFNLLEYLADQITSALFAYTQVARVNLRIEKLDRVAGSLGVAISRTRGDVVALDTANQPRTEVLFVNCDDGVPAGLALTPTAVLVPLLTQIAQEPAEQQILSLELDKWAWRLGATYGLPVIDTQTESDALAARNKRFVRAYGKGLFALSAPLAIINPEALIKWGLVALNAHRAEIYGYAPENDFEPPLSKYGATQ